MKITDLLKRCSIDLDGQVTSKEETIDHMVSLMVKSGNISDEEMYKSCVKKREEEGTTGTDNQKVSAVSQTGKVFIS